MNNNQRIISAIVALFLFGIISSAMGTRKKIYLQHKKSKTLQMDCVEIKGKEDPTPHYNCFDDNGNKKDHKLGTEWVQVNVNKVCFQHQVRDIFKTCLEIIGREKSSTNYICSSNEKQILFQPTDKWNKLSANDNRCASRLQSFDDLNVPRQTVFDVPGQTGFNVSGQAIFNVPGQTGFNVSGQTGFDVPKQKVFDVSGQTGFDVPGQAIFNLPGQTGFDVLSRQTGFDVPGQAIFNLPGQTGFNVSGQTGFDVPGQTIFNLPGQTISPNPPSRSDTNVTTER